MTFNIQEYNIMVIRDKIAAVAMEEMDAKLGHKLSRKMVMDAFGMGLLAHAQGIPLDCVPVEMRDGCHKQQTCSVFKGGCVMDKPESVSEFDELVFEDFLNYLDDLRESGATNMFGARPYLMDEFPELTKDQAGDVLSYWMSTFSERHKR
jgi:hypothetical protein